MFRIPSSGPSIVSSTKPKAVRSKKVSKQLTDHVQTGEESEGLGLILAAEGLYHVHRPSRR